MSVEIILHIMERDFIFSIKLEKICVNRLRINIVLIQRFISNIFTNICL